MSTQASHLVTIGSAAISATIAIAAYLIIMSIPSSRDPIYWNNLNWNHIGILPIASLIVSVAMLSYMFYLLGGIESNKEIKVFVFIVTAIYVFSFWWIQDYDKGNIIFNSFYAPSLMVISWLVCCFPFVWRNSALSLEKDWKIYLLLSTSLMCVAPLFTEIIIYLSWWRDGTFLEKTVGSALGANGFSDALFIFGFTTLLFSLSLILLRPKIASLGKKVVP